MGLYCVERLSALRHERECQTSIDDTLANKGGLILRFLELKAHSLHDTHRIGCNHAHWKILTERH